MSRSFAAFALLSLAIGAWTTATICRYHYADHTAATSNRPTQALAEGRVTLEASSSVTHLTSRAASSWAAVADLENEAAATSSKIERLKDEIAKTELELRAAEADFQKIPPMLEQLARKMEIAEDELPAIRAKLLKASATCEDFEKTVAERKQANRKHAATIAKKEFDDAVVAAREARQKRDELRRQVGAVRSTQDEAILENSKVRAARQKSEGTFVRLVTDADALVDGEGESLRKTVGQAAGEIGSRPG